MKLRVIFCAPSFDVRNPGFLRYKRAITSVFPDTSFNVIGPAGFSQAFSAAYDQKKRASDKLISDAEALKFDHTLLITFSAGYGFARSWFKENGIGVVDSYLAIDSIHGTKRLDNVGQFVEFAQKKKLFIIHTDIPTSYASTTEVANHIKKAPDADTVEVFSVGGRDAAAHIRALNDDGVRILTHRVLPFIKDGEMRNEGEKMLSGLDISHHQPPQLINWDVYAAQHDFVICRSNYGVRPDKAYPKHIKAAREKGVRVGAYIFFRQTQTALEQFDAMVAYCDLQDGDIAPVVDLEPNVPYDGPTDVEAHNVKGEELCRLLREHYGECIIYISHGHWIEMGKPAWVLNYPIWTAHWDVKQPTWPKDWVIWQYAVKPDNSYQRMDGVDKNVARELPLVKLNVDKEPNEDEKDKENHGDECENLHKEICSLMSKFEACKHSLDECRQLLERLLTKVHGF